MMPDVAAPPPESEYVKKLEQQAYAREVATPRWKARKEPMSENKSPEPAAYRPGEMKLHSTGTLHDSVGSSQAPYQSQIKPQTFRKYAHDMSKSEGAQGATNVPGSNETGKPTKHFLTDEEIHEWLQVENEKAEQRKAQLKAIDERQLTEEEQLANLAIANAIRESVEYEREKAEKTRKVRKGAAARHWDSPPRKGESKLKGVDRDTLAKLERDYHGPTLPNKSGEPAKLNERFWAALHANAHQTIYEPDENQLYDYVEPRALFVAQTTESLREQIAKAAYEMSEGVGGPYQPIPRFMSMQQLGGVVEALKGITEQKNAFKRTFKSPFYVHAANCMLVWNREGFHQEEFSPKFKSRNQSPIAYEPEAGYSDFHEAFLARLPDYDASVIKKYFGQCLLGRNLTQSILLMDGVADSSKTTLALVLSTLIGQDNCAELRTSLLDERFEISGLIGKTLLTAPDVKANFLSLYGASIIKRLCGGDLGDAEFKRSNRRIQYEGVYNMIVTSNARLRAKLEGDAGAWRRRLLIVRFEVPRNGERIVDFHLEIMNREGPGILNYALQGAKDLMTDLKRSGGISQSTEQIARVNKFIDESDSLRNFVRDQLCATTESAHDVTVNEVLDRYYKHCVDNDINSLSTKDAKRDLDELMRELFGRSQSNSVQREGKAQRGYPKTIWRKENDEN